MNRLAAALLFLAVPVLALGWASCAGDTPETLIDATPVAACPQVPHVNPCKLVDCDRTDVRKYT